jgi:conjugal transfer pilus assembly protein TraW
MRAGTAPVHAAIAVVVLLACTPGRADNLGVIGPTYPIGEPHLLEQIRSRLLDKARSGELRKLEEQARNRATESVLHPEPVAGLRLNTAPRTFYFDPSFTLAHNVVDASGAVLFPAGLRSNPLDVVSLSRHLLFFDGRDERQVAKARELMARYQGRVKPILVGGSYIELMKAWNTRVYYDQQGLLVRRLGITGVPAIVSQEGSRLRIDEVSVR